MEGWQNNIFYDRRKCEIRTIEKWEAGGRGDLLRARCALNYLMLLHALHCMLRHVQGLIVAGKCAGVDD